MKYVSNMLNKYNIDRMKVFIFFMLSGRAEEAVNIIDIFLTKANLVKCKILENRIFLKIIDFKKWNKKKNKKTKNSCFPKMLQRLHVWNDSLYDKLIIIFM